MTILVVEFSIESIKLERFAAKNEITKFGELE